MATFTRTAQDQGRQNPPMIVKGTYEGSPLNEKSETTHLIHSGSGGISLFGECGHQHFAHVAVCGPIPMNA